MYKKNKKFDIVIASRNRESSLKTLVGQIFNSSLLPDKVIIVDSSNVAYDLSEYKTRVIHLRTSYKNQPIQRYIGFKECSNEFIIFFDDDMRILNNNSIEAIISSFRDPHFVGVQPKIIHSNSFYQKKMPKSPFRDLAKRYVFFKILKLLSGNPNIQTGKFWYSGLRGSNPEFDEDVEWFNGPVFALRRSKAYLNFNYKIFEIYSNNYGKGEDAILGLTTSKFGKIIFKDIPGLFHEDSQDSVYTKNFFVYAKRLAYSRLYMSYEYARIKNKPYLFAFIFFNLYIFGRVGTLFFNQLCKYDKKRNLIIKGIFIGFITAIRDRKSLKVFKHEANI